MSLLQRESTPLETVPNATPLTPPLTDLDMSTFGQDSDSSFSHLVQTGWDTECELFGKLRPDPNFGELDVAQGDTYDTSFGHQDYLHSDDFCGKFDDGYSASLGISEDGYWQDAESEQVSLQSELGETSAGSVDELQVTPDISACVELAYSLLPASPPKPIWEQGIWADIFGDGNFLKSSWVTGNMARLPWVSDAQTASAESSDNLQRKPKIPRLDICDCTYSDIVVNKSDCSWQEERESTLQNALKRWLVDKLKLLADILRGKSPSTMLKRVRAAEKMVQYFGIGGFPPTEEAVYGFFDAERASSVLLSVYSRARWADLMHCDKIIVDKGFGDQAEYIEAHVSVYKTMRAATFKHRFLPLTAPAVGVHEDCWVESWLKCRANMGVQLPPEHAVMPAPNPEGRPSLRPLSSGEASQWLRKLLTGSKEVNPERKVSSHSLKATCLSYCAKYGVEPLTRLQLGYHSGGGEGLRMVHTYSRDAISEPLAKLVQVLSDIRNSVFFPDCTRSGRFAKPKAVHSDMSIPVAPMPVLGREEANQGEPHLSADVVDLVSEKSESSDESDEGVTSSSDSQESPEEFQEEQRQMRLFLPPVPPAGYVFWQHVKLKTLHLAPPDYKRVFLCNRLIGPNHCRDRMNIRYDTPICRMCVQATKADGKAGKV
eukprot:s2074_g21.t1